VLIYGSLLLILSTIVGLTALDRRNLAYLYAFFLPFFGIIYEIGLQVNPEKLVTAYMLLVMVVLHEQFRYHAHVLLYLVVAIVVTAMLSVSLPDYADQFPLLRGRLRWVFQIVYLLMAFAPLHYIPSVLKTHADIKRLLFFFVVSCVLNAGMGIAQYLVYQATGTDIFPMSLFMGTELSNTALYDLGQLRIMRVCGLGGEPKHLAYSLTTGFILVFTWFLVAKEEARRLLFCMALFVVCIFLTLSSQGIILLAAALILVPLALMFAQKRVSVRGLGMLLGVAALSWYVWNYTFAGTLLRLRTVERLTESDVGGGEGGIEDFDLIIVNYLKDHPHRALTGFGLGNVHFYTRDYIPDELRYYIDKSVFVSKKGAFRILSETGALGLCLFLAMFAFALLRLLRLRLSGADDRLRVMLFVATSCVLIDFLVACDGPFYTVLMLASVLAFNRLSRT
jgi:hypothetical protein